MASLTLVEIKPENAIVTTILDFESCLNYEVKLGMMSFLTYSGRNYEHITYNIYMLNFGAKNTILLKFLVISKSI